MLTSISTGPAKEKKMNLNQITNFIILAINLDQKTSPADRCEGPDRYFMFSSEVIVPRLLIA